MPACCPRILITSVSFYSQNCPSLDDRLRGHPIYDHWVQWLAKYLWLIKMLCGLCGSPDGRCRVEAQRILEQNLAYFENYPYFERWLLACYWAVVETEHSLGCRIPAARHDLPSHRVRHAQEHSFIMWYIWDWAWARVNWMSRWLSLLVCYSSCIAILPSFYA